MTTEATPVSTKPGLTELAAMSLTDLNVLRTNVSAKIELLVNEIASISIRIATIPPIETEAKAPEERPAGVPDAEPSLTTGEKTFAAVEETRSDDRQARRYDKQRQAQRKLYELAKEVLSGLDKERAIKKVLSSRKDALTTRQIAEIVIGQNGLKVTHEGVTAVAFKFGSLLDYMFKKGEVEKLGTTSYRQWKMKKPARA